MTFDPNEKRGPDGRWIGRLIHLSDLSSEDGRRSREVSEAEFQETYHRGEAKFNRLKGTPSPALALKDGPDWDKVVGDSFDASREPWGGATIDAHTGAHVAHDADSYALTMRAPGMDTVSVDPAASREDFAKAMHEARTRYRAILRRPGSHLGVFHDEDSGRIDIDPVLVTPSLEDVEDIGAYTHAVGGAYHFKSGDGYWPPHVKDKAMDFSYVTPAFEGEYDLAVEDGRLAFWKQILPKRQIHYTAKDGARKTLDFNEKYLTDLATNQAVDKVGFLLADTNNAHTMDPERFRGTVERMEVREDGLYGKIVFPNREAAKAVLDNPELGVSARIREGVQRSDGSTLNRGIIHVLGTLDPQVSGMSGWQTADLSMSDDDVLDLSNETFEEGTTMALSKPLADYTEDEINAFTEEELEVFLTEADALLDGTLEAELEAVELEPEAEPEMSLSNETQTQIDLANGRANEALRRMAEAEWKAERERYLNAGVPPHLLDLATPVLNRPDEFVVDLSVTDGSDAEVNVGEIVRGLLDAAKGSIDLSVEAGHSGTFVAGDAEDPDTANLALWADQS